MRLFLFVLICLSSLSTSSRAADLYTGPKYSIADKNTSGLCHLVNNSPCEKQEISSSALESVISGKVDLASVLTDQIKPDSNLRVIMHLTSDKKFMLVTREDFPETDANEVIKAIENFLRSGRERTQSRLIQEFVKLPPIYGGRDALEPFLKFDETYPLHPAISSYYKTELEKPLSITYGIEECERGTNRCSSISDIAVENYRASQKISYMGMGVAPFLIENLKSDNPNLVAKSANAIGRIWPQDSKILTPPLLEIIDHPDDEVKEQAISALASLEPIQPEAVNKLIEIAQQEPVQRESFSDGSHGMSQQKTVLVQQPITYYAAYGLGRIANEKTLNALKSLVRSDSEAKQTQGILGLEQYLFREMRELRKDKSHEELVKITNKFSIEMFPEKPREILTFLELQQENLPDENKKLVVNILNRHNTGKVSEDTISALVKDLYSDKQQCQKRHDGTEHCEFNEMRQALYKLKGLGTNASTPAVFQGIENVLKTGAYSELEVAYRLLSDLASNTNFPDSLISLMIEKANETQKEVSFEALAVTANANPQWQNKVQSHLEKFLSDEEKWARQAAIKGLATLGGLSKNNKLGAPQKIIDTIRQEPDVSALRYMIKELGKLGQDNDSVKDELFKYASYRQDIIDAFFTADKSSPMPRIPSLGNDTRPLDVNDVYNIRVGALEAIQMLDSISKDELNQIKAGYEKELLRTECRNTRRPDYLNFAKSSYIKHSGSISNLMPAIVKALDREDNTKCGRWILNQLRNLGAEADVALPILEKRLDEYNRILTVEIFVAVRSIDSPAARAFLDKYADIDPKNKNVNKPAIINLLDGFSAYYEIEPAIENAEMHIIAVERSRSSEKPAKVTIEVDYPDKPILLMLYGLETIAWTVKPINGTQISAIRLGGKELQVADDIPNDIPVTGYVGEQRDYSAAGGITGEYARAPLEEAKVWTGKEPKTFQYFRFANNVRLDKNTPEKPSFSLGTHLSKVFDENGNLRPNSD